MSRDENDDAAAGWLTVGGVGSAVEERGNREDGLIERGHRDRHPQQKEDQTGRSGRKGRHSGQ